MKDEVEHKQDVFERLYDARREAEKALRALELKIKKDPRAIREAKEKVRRLKRAETRAHRRYEKANNAARKHLKRQLRQKR